MCYNRRGETQKVVKQIKYVIFVLICMCVTPLITHAECDYQRQAELSRLASNVQFSYNYDNSANFTINITNITDDIYVSYFNPSSLSNEILSGIGEKNIQVGAGTTLNFEIYSNDPNCSGNLLLNKYITTPTYNSFSTYDECQQFPNFKYCQLWLNTTLTDKQFETEFTKYKTIRETKKVANSSDEGFWQVLVNYFENNRAVLTIGFVFIIMLIISLILIKLLRRKH